MQLTTTSTFNEIRLNKLIFAAALLSRILSPLIFVCGILTAMSLTLFLSPNKRTPHTHRVACASNVIPNNDNNNKNNQHQSVNINK